MTCMIMDGEKTLDRSVLDFFLKGDNSLEGNEPHSSSMLSLSFVYKGVVNPNPTTWLMASGWKDLCCVENLNARFADLANDFRLSPQTWKVREISLFKLQR
jgi:hypothetical protein